MTSSHVDEPNYLLEKLMPLRYGMTVRLVQVTTSKHGRLAVARERREGVLFAPGALYGVDPMALVVSVLGHGSCMTFPLSGKAKADLIRAGIAPGLVDSLTEALAKVYGE